MRVYIAGAMTGKFKYKENFSRGDARVRELGHNSTRYHYPYYSGSGFLGYSDFLRR